MHVDTFHSQSVYVSVHMEMIDRNVQYASPQSPTHRLIRTKIISTTQHQAIIAPVLTSLVKKQNHSSGSPYC